LGWQDNFYVELYPANADVSESLARYINSLKQDDFAPIESFFAEEAARYSLNMQHSIAIELGNVVEQVPPPPPSNGNTVQTIL
jgi:hypothetical protein